MKKEIIDLVFKQTLPVLADIEAKYPPRRLPAGAEVTRIAPSPTGMMHLGNLNQALIAERLAHTTNGVFMLRVEDTDQKRKTEGAIDVILAGMDTFGLHNDEGPVVNGPEKGAYGPYYQSDRRDIYQAYIRQWLEEDKAYLCFCTEEENETAHHQQKKQNVRPGYYGGWARCRNLSENEVLENLKAGKNFVVRFKSPGSYNKKIVVEDVLRGKREFPENDLDIVIMKGDGLPTYHFAHLIDDHLMRTTLVNRGEEWLPSLPLHIQLFQVMGWEPPKYAHLSHIQKLDENGNRRKLSKRLDPEANLAFFPQNGYPKMAVIEYLMNIDNSNFEDWRKTNPDKAYKDFDFSIKKMNSSGALFDFVKLNSIAREIIGRMTAGEVYDLTLAWMKQYDVPFSHVMEQNADYIKQILNIEREGAAKIRKDITKWSDVKNEVSYFLDDQFLSPADEMINASNINDIKTVVKEFRETYNPSDTRDEWFAKIKNIAAQNGFATDMKAYKADPSAFKGSVADVAKILRVLVTGREQSPDLYSIMLVMGKDRVFKRLALA